jgi:hypothetical protein
LAAVGETQENLGPEKSRVVQRPDKCDVQRFLRERDQYEQSKWPEGIASPENPDLNLNFDIQDLKIL